MTRESVSDPLESSRQTGWRRALPDADHRWNMGLRRIDAGEFLAPRDSTGSIRAERMRWLEENPDLYAALMPGAEAALQETVALAESLGTSIDTSLAPWDQLLALGRAWESDFVWMQADAAGEQRLTGGVVCFPSSWDLHEKLGRSISETHGPVPGLNDVLGRQIDTFLSKLPVGVAWGRENAGYSRVPDLNQHPSRTRPRLDATVTPDEFWIRIEHQLLLRLPASHSILFAIRVEIIPLRQVLEFPDITARLARQLETISSDAAEYKAIREARDAIIPFLHSCLTDNGPPGDNSATVVPTDPL